MKVKKWLGLALLTLAITACSSDDNNNGGTNNTDDDGGTLPTNYMVAAEVGPSGFNVQYEYNDSDLLETWTTSYNSSTGYELTFNYNDDNSVLSADYIDSDGVTDALSFQYDFQGHLIGYVGLSNDVSLDWNDNVVTASGTIAGFPDASATLELDTFGRVSKMTTGDFYSTFQYDANGNLTNMSVYDSNDALQNEYSIIYDSNPNPFFGQLPTIYLERFLTNFYEEYGIFYSGIEGYTFPYHRNNILSIEKDGNQIVSYSMAYDANDYPTIISEIIQGDSFQYQITYN